MTPEQKAELGKQISKDMAEAMKYAITVAVVTEETLDIPGGHLLLQEALEKNKYAYDNYGIFF